MFTKHPDNMRMEPTPERVYSICRLISQEATSKENLRELVSLGKSESSSSSASIINYSLDVAEKDLGIIQLKDGKYSIVADPKCLQQKDHQCLGSSAHFQLHVQKEEQFRSSLQLEQAHLYS